MSLLVSVVNSVPVDYGETEMSDEMLVSIAKSGDANAFVELSKRHADKVFQSAHRITRNQQDAEDALQDSFLKAFIHLKNFEERSSFSTWLTRIAINQALMILRKKRSCCEISIDGPAGPERNFETWELRSPMEDPESSYARRERQTMLSKAVDQLPPLCRDVIQLKQAKGYSTKQLAKSLGVSIPAVKSRMSRAKRALRTSLVQGDWQSPSY